MDVYAFNWQQYADDSDYDYIEHLANKLTGMFRGGYRGISHKDVPETAKVAWDIQQVVRHAVSWHKNPKGGLTVNFDKPLPCAMESLAKCEVADG